MQAAVAALLALLLAASWALGRPVAAADGTRTPAPLERAPIVVPERPVFALAVEPPAPASVVTPIAHRSSHHVGGADVEVWHPASAGPHPVVVFAHGGGWVRGDHLALPVGAGLEDLAAAGWAIVSVGYPLASADTGVRAHEQVDSLVAVLEWLAGGALGPRRDVVVVGHSAGAHLAAAAADRVSPASAPALVVGIGGVYDFEADVLASPLLVPLWRHALGCEPVACEPAQVAALVPSPTAVTAPLLLVHGDHDTVVPLATAQRFANRAWSVGAAVELQVVAGAGHNDAPLLGAVRDRLLSWASSR